MSEHDRSRRFSTPGPALRHPREILPYARRWTRDVRLRLRAPDHVSYYRAVVRSNAARGADFAVGSPTRELWLIAGTTQFDYLLTHGLRRDARMLEIGCGNLRAGRHFIEYLDAGNYHGIDISPEVLLSALDTVTEFALQAKRPHLTLVNDLTLSFLPEAAFDIVHAHSVFSHSPIEVIEQCLQHVGRVMADDAFFDFTFHMTTGSERDVLREDFYYRLETLTTLAAKYGLQARLLEDWQPLHPQSKLRLVQLPRDPAQAHSRWPRLDGRLRDPAQRSVTRMPTAARPGADAAGVVLVVPLMPQIGGNGLAMRAGMLLDSLATRFAVDLVVVPVSGPGGDAEWASGLARSLQIVTPAAGEAARRHVTLQLADAMLRRRLEATAPLPALARSSPPTLAGAAAAMLADRPTPPAACFVLRGYLAPFGCSLARLLDAARIVVDLDDDDEMLARSMGANEEADAIARLGRAWLHDADVVCAAAEHEARAVAERYALPDVRTLPNAIRVPASIAPPPGEGRLLFVGNLTYAPNVEAAGLLTQVILPIVQLDHPHVTVDLVGPHAADLQGSPSVRVAGMVEDLEPWYRAADVVVVPLRHGAGTRIKVLEAFAHRRPVVATPVAVRGLAVRDGHDVLIGDSPAELAAAITRLLAAPEAGARLAEHAAQTLASRYVKNAVAPLICDLVTAPIDRQPGHRPKEPR